MNNKIINKKNLDYIVVFAVLFQSCLVIFQQILIGVYGMIAEDTTIYRIVLTAIPMIIAIVISIARRPSLWIIVYVIVFCILSIQYILFPENSIYIKNVGFRFLIPVVIPSALCLMTVRNINTVEKVMYIISWITLILVVFYILQYFKGGFSIERYNMSFSYGVLLSMVCFYSRKRVFDIILSIFLFLVVVSIGSRGAAVVFVIYVFLDIVIFYKKYIPIALIVCSLLIIFMPFFVQWLDLIGIESRTLNLAMSGDLGEDSGRSVLHNIIYEKLFQHPLLGLGIYGDRYYLNGMYCHNILLEILLNWGILLGLGIIVWLIIYIYRVFVKLNKYDKGILLKYIIAIVVPLMVSGSYLSDYNFGAFCGILYLLNYENKQSYRISNKFNI